MSSISWFHVSKSEVSISCHESLSATVSPSHLGAEVPRTLDTKDCISSPLTWLTASIVVNRGQGQRLMMRRQMRDQNIGHALLLDPLPASPQFHLTGSSQPPTPSAAVSLTSHEEEKPCHILHKASVPAAAQDTDDPAEEDDGHCHAHEASCHSPQVCGEAGGKQHENMG